MAFRERSKFLKKVAPHIVLRVKAIEAHGVGPRMSR
jgi:hypothetical protein